MSPPAAPAPFHKDRHIKYWLRCLKTFLPTSYTSNDANRMLLATFTLSALDLLSALDTHTTPAERAAYADWIYSCQHPAGGFRSFNGTDFGGQGQDGSGRWDSANVAGTFFALVGLAVLGDSLDRVRRKETLAWLKKLQLEDGSFAEVLGDEGPPEGGQDVRFCFLAALVRWILRIEGEDEGDDPDDVDVEALAKFLIASQNYDGGLSQAPYRESHAGWTYCGIAALTLLKKFPSATRTADIDSNSNIVSQGFIQRVVGWLTARQTSVLDDRSNAEEEDDHSDNDNDDGTKVIRGKTAHVEINESPSDRSVEVKPGETLCAGFNGRCNKPADTCYSFWVDGALSVLDRVHLLDLEANRRYLLDKTQHIIGGFGKMPGDAPDILHSYLGLAALAVTHEPGLRRLDPILCISVTARRHLENLPWRKGA